MRAYHPNPDLTIAKMCACAPTATVTTYVAGSRRPNRRRRTGDTSLNVLDK